MEKDNSIPDDVKKQIEDYVNENIGIVFSDDASHDLKEGNEIARMEVRLACEHGYNLASKEIKELKSWKESAMSVMSPIQEIGKVIGVKPGHSIHDKILPAIQDLKAENERLKDNLKAAKLALKEIYTGTDFPLSIAQNALQVLNKESITRD